jgi:hypothetical protein
MKIVSAVGQYDSVRLLQPKTAATLRDIRGAAVFAGGWAVESLFAFHSYKAGWLVGDDAVPPQAGRPARKV